MTEQSAPLVPWINIRDVPTDDEKHHSEEDVVFLKVEGTEEVALAGKVDEEGRRENEVADVCSFVDKKVEIAVGVVLRLWKLYC